jgi:metallo-beta-lactamase family protein
MVCPRTSFHRAARSVTGSCRRVATAAREILLDCGMFQGSKAEKELNSRALAFAARHTAAVVLSRAHFDHSGLLPKPVRDGFFGPTTIVTFEPKLHLTELVLLGAFASVEMPNATTSTA